MDISNFVKQQGTFLKAEDVDKSQTKVFIVTQEAVEVHNEKFDTERLHIIGDMDAIHYIFDSSKTNARIIAEKLGADTKKWIGHTLVLETYKTKTKEGKLTLAVNVKEVK